jgi:hypothetical protein
LQIFDEPDKAEPVERGLSLREIGLCGKGIRVRRTALILDTPQIP